jgi:Trk K+ transport system NAD-binding subunit
MDLGEETNDPRNFIVCGANPMAFRLADELTTRYDVRVTAILPPAGKDVWNHRIRRLAQVEVVDADRLDADAFERAGLAEAAAIGLIESDDGGNIDAALLAQEINPEVRIVIRMFNLPLGERVAKLLNDCVVLSAAEIAAPVFVRAALDDSTTPVTIAGQRFVATRRDLVKRPEDIVLGLAIANSGSVDPEVLPPPESEGRTDIVLSRGAQTPPPRQAPPKPHAVTIMAVLIGARFRLVIAVMLLIFLAGTVALTWINGDLAQAAYVTIISELTGANADPTAPLAAKVTLTLLTIVSIALIPALTAAIVDSTVKARLRAERGGVPAGIAEHVVVVGLGHVGTRVVRNLIELGIRVVAIERDETAQGVQAARELDIPVIIGDASRVEVLNSASVATCRALVVVSTDDMMNLEISLLGKEAKPDLRVVVRIFDGDFARRVRRAFDPIISRSVSYLAAPAFAAAMLGRHVVATIPVRRRVLIIAELPVRPNSKLEHHPVAEVNRPGGVRLLAIRTGRDDQVLWFPTGGRRLVRTDRLIVVATRAGLGRLLINTRTPRTLPTPDQDALLDRWETPRQWPTQAIGRATPQVPIPADRPAGGPDDSDPTRPA